jgi:Holliday junction resolvase-like predicted endonuclease
MSGAIDAERVDDLVPSGDHRTAQQVAGNAAERLVAARLLETGWHVIGTNVRIGRDELDLIAVDPGPPRTLVFVEVRFRRRRDFGLPEETFGQAKRRRLWRALSTLLELGALPDGTSVPRLPIRIDLIVVEPPLAPGKAHRVRHHRAAAPA